jgi:ribonucleoside-diphosphate reductase alpha chain
MIFNTRLARENWASKYQYDGETALETYKRVARSIAEVERQYGASDQEVEEWYDRFLKTLVKFEPLPVGSQYSKDDEDLYTSEITGQTYRAVGMKATPAGRITANAGTDFDKATVWNCFINSPVSNAKINYSKRVPNSDAVIDCSLDTEETPDNLTNIFLSLLEAAETLKSEGGYGMNFGFIRPRGSFIGGVGIRHPGVVSYMELWDKMSGMIVKGDNDGYEDQIVNHFEEAVKDRVEKAQPRKGAMMAILPVWHPDVEEFVRAKQEAGRLTKFNISVMVDDAFMEAVQADDFYDLHFNGKTYKRVKARDLYDLIMESTYNRNEPGIMYFDNMNRNNPLIYLGPVSASNPCGEIPGTSFMDQGYQPAEYLKPYMEEWDDHLLGFTTVCLLGSINLTQFITDDRTFDYEGYAETIEVFTRMLDNVNDTGTVPLPAYEWAVSQIRQFGMGVNGLGSSMYMLGIRYGTDEAADFIDEIHRIKDEVTLRASALLAKEKGPFPMYDERYLETPYFKNVCTASEDTIELVRKYGVRNAKRLTNPPLGNSSIICDMVSNGIEPVFAHGYERTMIADKWPEGLTQDNVKDILDEIEVGDAVAWRGEYEGRIWYYEPHNRGLCFIDPVEDYGYSWLKEHFPEALEEGDDYLVTAQDLPVREHVYMQAKVQESCDQSVSKTANVPEEYPFDDFKQLYMDSWKAGLVGFTTYRAGTMESVLSTGEESGAPKQSGELLLSLIEYGCTPEDAEITDESVVVKDVKLPDEFSNGPTHTIRREGNKYYMHFSYLPNDLVNPVALWIHSNSYETGEYVTMNRAFRAVTKLLSAKGVSQDLVLDQVDKLHEDAYHVKLGKVISMAMRHNISLPDIVASISDIEGDYIATTLTAVRKFLTEHILDGTKATNAECPSCGSDDIIFESGCSACRSCGHSGCG